MAREREDLDSEFDGEAAEDGDRDFADHVEDKFGKDDEATGDDDDDADDPDEDTDDDLDGDDDDSDPDSDDDEDPSDEEDSDDLDDDDDDLDGEDDDLDGEDELDDEDDDQEGADEDADPKKKGKDKGDDSPTGRRKGGFRDAADDAGLDLSLEGLKGPARKIVEKKIRDMDRGFTRVMQQATEFRKEKATLAAELKFRDENPDLWITEQLLKDRKLAKKVQARLDKIDEEEAEGGTKDHRDAFDQTLKGKRGEALEKEREAFQAREQHEARVAEIVDMGQRIASKRGVPWSIAEKAIALAIHNKPTGKERRAGLSNTELREVIEEAADDYNKSIRRGRREQSRDVVRNRAKDRRGASPLSRGHRQSQSAGVGSKRPGRAPRDADDELAMIMRTGKRVFKGARDD